ncbi:MULTISPECIES: MFS transporter [unclassified Tenacibaculum]|uniref:MFS transporter n=1 Tax=unclassified Tenacibaculum TaxID=2635139 RepID=UPI001F1E77BF|nr:MULTISPECIES: MFS transporter [unclassified Tenacibaculum]MCF2874657.1 MFS transporter [Tenacibaculum sp. Cn5-1]MCF2934277.1 MFS transporter [Tenacibaculum sp. Cn5-34]MCG7510487.1 MFS transporter [Tenacibaculum sp. Cn5-46]
MKLKTFLIVMTLVAVVSDYLLHPFYPQFFELRFGMTNPKNVGYYFAAICFMVMIAFPFWAYVSKKVSELNILVYTQAVAGILALYCYYTTSYLNFWIVSLIMVLFKGSYLLVYPYILKIITKEEHPSTIGLLSVVVHLGGILGAVLGGITVDYIAPSSIFLIMAGGDFIQMAMSAYLLKSKKYATDLIISEKPENTEKKFIPKGFILKLGLITLILYFSDFLIRPFFSSYWESFSDYKSKLVSGTVYAIPGFVALVALWINNRRKSEGHQGIINALFIGLIGLLLQGIPYDGIVILGRIVYGWAIFQGVVKFDILLFELSTPESYSVDYSKIHFFQNLGVLLASLNVGIIVDEFGLQMPFAIALGGFLLTLILYFFVFKSVRKVHKQLAKA